MAKGFISGAILLKEYSLRSIRNKRNSSLGSYFFAVEDITWRPSGHRVKIRYKADKGRRWMPRL